jgi:alkylhydroperoxidase family enzyme
VGVNDEEIANIRNMDVDRMDLPEREKRLFILALKAHADPHSVTDEDFARLREVGVINQEIVEILEETNFGDSINRFCDTLGISPDAFLTYEMHP